MPPAALIDPATIDTSRLLVDLEGIREVNPQRFEMELLSAIVTVEPENKLIIGYKDLGADEFWVRGHMPGYPLMPGVLMCEAAAQLCGYYYVAEKVGDPGILMGLAGIDEARFVRSVRPGERLVVVGRGIKVHRRLLRFRVTGQVGSEKAFEVV